MLGMPTPGSASPPSPNSTPTGWPLYRRLERSLEQSRRSAMKWLAWLSLLAIPALSSCQAGRNQTYSGPCGRVLLGTSEESVFACALGHRDTIAVQDGADVGFACRRMVVASDPDWNRRHRKSDVTWQRVAVVGVVVGAVIVVAKTDWLDGFPGGGSSGAASASGVLCNDGFAARSGYCIPVSQATDDEIKAQMVSASVSAYSGPCPCPYNTDSAGNQCGGRSAHSRPGGYSPLCYTSDVSYTAVKRYKALYR